MQLDRDGKLNELTLWVAHPSDVEVIRTLDTDPRFSTPLSLSDEIQQDAPTNLVLHLLGTVRSHEPGKWVTIWDKTGQVIVQSKQTQPLRFGDRIEVIGHP